MPSKTPSGGASRAWADFEREIAKAYREAGFTQSVRVTKNVQDMHTSKSIWDVTVPEVPGMVPDMKYKKGGWSHHGVFKSQLHDRYLKGHADRFGVMHTKAGGEVGSYVVVTLQTWVKILAMAFLRNKKSDSWSCPRCGHEVAQLAKAMPNLFAYACGTCNLTFLSEDNHGAKT